MVNNGWIFNYHTPCVLCDEPIVGIGMCNKCWSEWTVTGSVKPEWLYGVHTPTGSTSGLLAMNASFLRKKASMEIPFSTLSIQVLEKI